MTVLPISAAKNQLSEMVESARNTSEEYTITVNGVPAAMLVSTTEWESLQETLFWLSQPGIGDELNEARAGRETGMSLGQDAIRLRYDYPAKV